MRTCPLEGPSVAFLFSRCFSFPLPPLSCFVNLPRFPIKASIYGLGAAMVFFPFLSAPEAVLERLVWQVAFDVRFFFHR